MSEKYKKLSDRKKGRIKHILFIVENNPVPIDPRVWNEAVAAREIGYEVTVICPITQHASLRKEEIDGIKIFRHYSPSLKQGKCSFLLEYGNALFWEILLSAWIYVKKPFQVIHAANPPDHIFLIAILFKPLGVKFIFDHHDLSPENYVAKFYKKDLFYYLLLFMEKLTFKTADLVISTNQSYKEIAVKRGNKNDKDVFVVRNGPKLQNYNFMKPNEKLKDGFEYLVGYVGVIGNQDGIDILLRAVRYIVKVRKIVNIKFAVIGTGTDWMNMVRMSRDLGVEKFVWFTGFIPYRDLYEIIATADVCVNPEFRNPFTDKSTMIKIMEYMVFGKPIIQFETTEGKITAEKASVYVRENSEEKFAETIIELLNDPKKRKKMGEYGRNKIKQHLNWDKQKIHLKNAYQYLENSF